MYGTLTREISASDYVFATLKRNGRVVANLGDSNFSSIGDVVAFVKRSVGKMQGFFELVIRNKTQGWNECGMISLGDGFLRLGRGVE